MQYCFLLLIKGYAKARSSDFFFFRRQIPDEWPGLYLLQLRGDGFVYFSPYLGHLLTGANPGGYGSRNNLRLGQVNIILFSRGSQLFGLPYLSRTPRVSVSLDPHVYVDRSGIAVPISSVGSVRVVVAAIAITAITPCIVCVW